MRWLPILCLSLLCACQAAPAVTITTPTGPIRVADPAYLNGQDATAQPPATINRITIWQSPERQRPACQAPHATKVTTEATTTGADGRVYVQVALAGCTGWVPVSFLSPSPQPVIGDLLP